MEYRINENGSEREIMMEGSALHNSALDMVLRVSVYWLIKY